MPFSYLRLCPRLLLAPDDGKHPNGLHLQLLHSVMVAGILQPYHSVSMPILLNAATDSWHPSTGSRDTLDQIANSAVPMVGSLGRPGRDPVPPFTCRPAVTE